MEQLRKRVKRYDPGIMVGVGDVETKQVLEKMEERKKE